MTPLRLERMLGPVPISLFELATEAKIPASVLSRAERCEGPPLSPEAEQRRRAALAKLRNLQTKGTA